MCGVGRWGSLELERWESTVTGAEGNNMRTKINILVVVVQAIVIVRDTNLIQVGIVTDDLIREHVAN